MSIRPIQRTDRAISFTPVQSVTAYGAYPYREGEPQLPPERGYNWNSSYRQAAQSAAEWLLQCRQAYMATRVISSKIRNDTNTSNLLEQLQELTDVMNQLHEQYIRLSVHISPDQWIPIQQSMNHPAAEMLGLNWNTPAGGWTFDSSSIESTLTTYSTRKAQATSPTPITQQLLGSSGLLTVLQKALSKPSEMRAIDVLRSDITLLQPYISYYNSMQTYWPFPSSGCLLSRHL